MNTIKNLAVVAVIGLAALALGSPQKETTALRLDQIQTDHVKVFNLDGKGEQWKGCPNVTYRVTSPPVSPEAILERKAIEQAAKAMLIAQAPDAQRKEPPPNAQRKEPPPNAQRKEGPDAQRKEPPPNAQRKELPDWIKNLFRLSILTPYGKHERLGVWPGHSFE